MTKSKYMLVDISNLFHRSKYVTSGDPFEKAETAISIVFHSMNNCLKKFKTTHTVICADSGSWRNSIYPEYKSHRKVQRNLRTAKEREDDEIFFAVMNEVLEYFKEKTNMTVLHKDDIEADDFIARWVQLHDDSDHVIISADSDLHQLISHNVQVYDGIKGWTLSVDGVFDENGKPAVTSKNITTTDENGKKVKKVEKTVVPIPNPEYILFKKIIRGDSSDSILSAYPGVRENGSKNKPGIIEAFEDRNSKGYNWNNFMQQEWDKPIKTDSDDFLFERVSVIDQFKINQTLIDLTKQPEHIKEIMDEHILEMVQKPPVPQVGIWFMKFTSKYGLDRISSNASDFQQLIGQKYST